MDPYFILIEECKLWLFLDDRQCRIHHCYPEAITAADWMANWGVELEDNIVFFSSPPSSIYGILLEDFRRVVWPRMVREYAPSEASKRKKKRVFTGLYGPSDVFLVRVKS